MFAIFFKPKFFQSKFFKKEVINNIPENNSEKFEISILISHKIDLKTRNVIDK